MDLAISLILLGVMVLIFAFRYKKDRPMSDTTHSPERGPKTRVEKVDESLRD